MQRRLMLSLAGAGVLLTAGCGFRLRGTPNFAFKSIYVNAPGGSGLGDDLRRALTANSALRVISNPQQMLEADVILDVLADQREKPCWAPAAPARCGSSSCACFFLSGCAPPRTGN